MNFKEKMRGAFYKIKTRLIVGAILMILFIFFAICPLAVALHDAVTVENDDDMINSSYNSEIVFKDLASFFDNPGKQIGMCFTKDYFPAFSRGARIVIAIYLVFAGVGFFKAIPKHEFDDIEHGSSKWSEGGEQYAILSKKKGIILAEKNYLPVDKRGNVNVLVVGGSGAGKSASYVIPNAIQLLGSYVFTDPKGELYDKTAGYFKSQGYDVKVLNLVSPDNSDGYNPLHHITSDVDVDVIANTIVKGQGDGAKAADPFWDDMAEMLLKSLIYYLKATRPLEEQSLASCSELVRAANNNGGDNLLANLINELPFDNQARKNFKNIETLPDKTYGSVLGTLQSKLGKFDTPAIAELTSTDTIDFQEIASKKTAVYVISSDTHAAYDFLLTIFFSQMIQQLYDYADKCGGALPIPTYFILDEFANIGKIPDFDKKISTSRSRKISFSVILQNLDQLEAVYEKAHETIIGNCDTHLFLGSNSQKTVEYFSKALGEKTIGSDSFNTNRDVQGWKTGDSYSINKSARALMTADELRRMNNDLCIIFEKGINPVKAKKYYYFKYRTAKIVEQYKLDHNELHVDRGEWRTFNPYNPYDASKESGGGAPAKALESLDDLFADEMDNGEKVTVGVKTESSNAPAAPKKEVVSKEQDKTRQEELVDIQKELEAKFDELFGSLDD